MGDAGVGSSSSADRSLPIPPVCGGRTRDGRLCPIPPTESSGYAWCFRHTPGSEERVSRWASEASHARDGKLSRRVRKLLKRAELDDLDGVLRTRKALWRCGAAGVIAVDRYRALDSTLSDFAAFYSEQAERRPTQALIVEIAKFGTESTSDAPPSSPAPSPGS
jgi:hypothetical protein